MLLNFWEISTLTQNFVKLYGFNESKLREIFKALCLNNNQDIVSVFCEKTGVNLDEIDVSNDIEFIGKIVSTTIDDCNYIKKVGLVPLDVLLENDSPIKKHLKKYQIEIRPSEHRMIYRGKCFYIPLDGENCEKCVFGEDQCIFSNRLYKNSHCDYLKAIRPLSIKLYKYKSEIEMFLFGSTDAIIEYSNVKFFPEIFDTIESFIRSFLKKDLNIAADWTRQKQYSYIITLSVKYNDISEVISHFSGTDKRKSESIFLKYQRFCCKVYNDIEQVPKCFWDNIWLIKTCLNIIFSINGSNEEIYAAIKHDVKIPYDKLKIDKIDFN